MTHQDTLNRMNSMLSDTLMEQTVTLRDRLSAQMDRGRDRLLEVTSHNPEKAAQLIETIERNERIMVYGDYDVDGTTSVAMVSSFFKGLPIPGYFQSKNQHKPAHCKGF